MCGLFGVAGNLFQKDIAVYHDMMWAGALRGMHGTGSLIVKKDYETKVIKCAGTPLHLRMEEEFDKAISFSDRVLFGHNRHATVGNHSDENAHPFDFPIVAGAHNGTLRGRSDYHLDHRKKFGTDSEALYFNINNHGVEEVIPKMEGAWALTWWNKVEGTINFLRNSERPLHYAFSKSGQQMYWASEAHMLRWILNRNGVELADAGIMSLKVDTHVKWDVTDGNETFKEPTITELKGHSVDFFERDHFRGVMQGWAPRHIPTTGNAGGQLALAAPRDVTPSQATTGTASPRKLSEIASKAKSSSAVQPNVVAVKQDNKTTLRVKPRGPIESAAPYEKTAYENGFKAGQAGKSLKNCPHPPLSVLGIAWTRGRNDGLEASKPKADKVKEALTQAVEEGRFIRAFNNEYMGERAFKERTGTCCSYCDQPQVFGDMAEARWLNRTQFICVDCIEQTDTYSTILKDYGAVA